MGFVYLLIIAVALHLIDWWMEERSKDWWCEYMIEEMNKKAGL